MTGESPPSAAASIEKLRQTINEARALSTTIGRVPEEVIWQRPGEQPSIAELLWLIHLADEYRFRPVVDAIARSLHPRMGHVNALVLLGTDPVPDPDEIDVGEILSQIVESRGRLVERVESLPEESWVSDVVEVEGRLMSTAGLVEGICGHDREILREVGQRLMESDLGR